MATADIAPSQISPRSQDLWNEWKSRIGRLRSALISRSPDCSLSEITSGCLALYRNVYGSKQCNTKDALAKISGRDRSPLEIAFMWLGGWITLAYSTLTAILREQDGVSVSNNAATGPISTSLARQQLEGLRTLLKLAQDTEEYLSNELATLQMLAANQTIVEALATDAISTLGAKDWKKGRELMEINVAALTCLFIQANQLRLQTLEELMRLLTPTQRAHCCISAFELMHAIKAMRSTSLQDVNLS